MKKPHWVTCKFCGERFDAQLEGVTYRDDSHAHEECDDAEEFRQANAFQLAEHEA